MRKGEVLQFLHEEIIYSNKKYTSDFHGTVSFGPIKMSQRKFIKRSTNKSWYLFDFVFLTGVVIEPKVKTAQSTIISKFTIKT